ncbi:DNRLRE domain-containing protein [Dyadobacter flavalbus]|uniref:DNRLRE domain-containing protein n=1 Tax=Dyadobacter flavalbus TaxID=2579942 RepID=A0A5M8QQ74_9BACT|nr:malectin domain-containing carbohydrate-binding protein [Dyadobacter flavalbus]KAA6438387.1 DNRLRE domain-containing protein [Dyadobacter flavalbus]
MKNPLLRNHLIKSLLAFVVFAQASVFAQPVIQWDKTIGSNGYDDLKSIMQDANGEYLLTGTGAWAQISGDRTEAGLEEDPWIVKLRPDGTKKWDDIVTPLSGPDWVYMAVRTSDGGLAIAGSTETAYFIRKLDYQRNVQWAKYFSSDSDAGIEIGFGEIHETADGGIIVGMSSTGGAKPAQGKDEASVGGYDYWIIKFSADGQVQWNNTIGGTGSDICRTVRQTTDGGYIVGGSSNSGIGFDKTEAPVTGSDMWIVKLDANGVVSWDKTIGGPAPTSLIQTADGGYVAGGYSSANAGGDKSENSKGGVDMWIVKLTSYGSVIWDRTIGGTGDDYCLAVIEQPDGSIIASGQTGSGAGADKTEASWGLTDLWVVKLSGSGVKVWDKTLGGSLIDRAERNSLISTLDGGFIVGGTSGSNASGNKTENSRGGDDYWVVKFAPEPSLAASPIRINAGGQAFTTATKKLFIADQYYAGLDRTSSIASGDILNTSNDVLYRSARCSPSFSYNIPVPNGEVSVYLHFAETYYGAPGKKGGKGSRQFHVNMEGSRKLTNYDIFAKAGGAMLATAETFTVNVTDGMLNIDFLTGAADLPRVSAIEVLPSPQRTLTFTPQADATVRDGIYQNQNFGSDPLLGTKGYVGTPRDLQRVSYLKFAIPGITNVKSAKLRVYGKNHENMEGITLVAGGVLDDSWTENGITKANAPSYLDPTAEARVLVNGELKYRDLDVTEFVRMQATGDKVVSLALATRSIRLLNFHSKENPSGFVPQLVIVTDNTINQVTRLGNEIEAEPKAEDALSSVIYPNPAKDHIMLEVSSGHKSEVDLELTNLAGSRFRLQRPEIEANSSRLKVGLPAQLPAGMYLLKVRSKEFSEVLKVLVKE